jgi:threonine/homoserine/homoserine lactone efflux protein
MPILAAIAALLVAFLFGFMASIPPAGPIAALVIQQSAQGEHQRALRIGTGAALTESVFAALAAGAVWVVSAHEALLHRIGFGVAALLFPIMGLRLIFWMPSASLGQGGARKGGLLLGAAIAALNPGTFVAWGTVVTLLHSARLVVDGPLIPLFGIAGGVGVLSWFALFVALLKRHLGRLSRGLMTLFVRCLGCLLVAIGLGSALALLRQWLGPSLFAGSHLLLGAAAGFFSWSRFAPRPSQPSASNSGYPAQTRGALPGRDRPPSKTDRVKSPCPRVTSLGS